MQVVMQVHDVYDKVHNREAQSSDLLNCLLLIQQLFLISPLTKAFLATRFRFFITVLAPLSTCSITHERKGTTGCIPEAEEEEKHVLFDRDKTVLGMDFQGIKGEREERKTKFGLTFMCLINLPKLGNYKPFSSARVNEGAVSLAKLSCHEPESNSQPLGNKLSTAPQSHPAPV